MTVRSFPHRPERLPSRMYTPGRSIISPKLAFATDRWLLRNAKNIPEREVRTLSAWRPMVVYHHNSRRKGGHRAEIADWQRRLPGSVYAYYWRRKGTRCSAPAFILDGGIRRGRCPGVDLRSSPVGPSSSSLQARP